MDSDSFNPYAAPLAGRETVDPFQQDDTQIRREFIDCEANVRSISELMVLGGLIVAACSAILLFVSAARFVIPGIRSILLLALLAFGFAQMIVGFRVRRFLPGARIAAIIFCGLWLVFIPVGTIFGGASLWYLVRPAATYVFTQEYRDVIKRTPHVHFRTSAASWTILAVVLLGVLGLVVLSNM